MIEIILFLMPSFASMEIDNNLNKKNKKILDFILNFCIYVVINTILSFGLTYIISSNKEGLISYNIDRFDFCVKYLIISLFFSIVIPFIKYIINSNFKISIKKGN